ncbi:MAG TPA: alpha/beta fold hydrolase [Clostridia bacterium]|nr:alpha/beta fold hydrolase [Clostridia bacterium]
MKRIFLLGSGILAAGLIAFLLTGGTYTLGNLSLVLVWAIAGMGMVIIIGNTGQLSLGHAAFMAIGAYSTAIFTELLPGIYGGMLLGTLIGLFIATVFALLIGLPALRLRGYYLAIATIAFGVGMEQAIRAMPFPNPVYNIPHILSFTRPGPIRDIATYVLMTALFLLFYAIGLVILKSPFGVKFRMIRDSQVAARSYGTNLAANKLQAFIVSAVFCALAGSMYAVTQGVIQPVTFGLMAAIDLLLIIIIGGAILLEGGLIGSFIIVGLPALVLEELVPPGSLTLIYGILLIIFVIALPSGIATELYIMWNRKMQVPYMAVLRFLYRLKPVKGSFVETIEGKQMYYVAQGEGPILLYIHGNTGSHQWFREVMDVPGYRTVAIDLMNFGRSDRIETTDDIDTYADHVAAFIDQLGLETCYVAGHSFGGAVAMSLAIRYPNKVRRMLLIDSAPIDGLPLGDDSEARIEALRRHYGVLKSAIGKVMGSRSKDRHLHSLLTKEALLMNREAYFNHALALDDFDYSEGAASFNTPALVIRGVLDPLISDEDARRTAEALKAELQVFDNIGHALIIEDPEAFKKVAVTFDKDSTESV